MVIIVRQFIQKGSTMRVHNAQFVILQTAPIFKYQKVGVESQTTCILYIFKALYVPPPFNSFKNLHIDKQIYIYLTISKTVLHTNLYKYSVT